MGKGEGMVNHRNLPLNNNRQNKKIGQSYAMQRTKWKMKKNNKLYIFRSIYVKPLFICKRMFENTDFRILRFLFAKDLQSLSKK